LVVAVAKEREAQTLLMADLEVALLVLAVALVEMEL
jgi:hypothetical protein